jgi:predicted nucleotidyltransferase component of viral defense system
MIHPALAGLIDRYQPQSSKDYQNAVREIVQEIALLGLWRTPFYEHAAFYGGSALRIFHGLQRFSEDLDFFKVNPEINAKLEAFIRSEPRLVEFVKQIPREQLERKFLLPKMQDQQQKEGYTAKVKAWLEKPEQAEVLKAIRFMISPVMKPERQEQVIVNQAKNFIKNSGVKLS